MASTDPPPNDPDATTHGRASNVEGWLRTHVAAAYDRATCEPTKLLTATELRARLRKKAQTAK